MSDEPGGGTLPGLKVATLIAPEVRGFYERKRVCVTGGAGFIGSHLAAALAGLGAEVAIIDDLSWGTRANLAEAGDRVRFVEGSILDGALLAEAVAGAEVVFHEAALTSVAGSVEKPAEYMGVNATGTVFVMEAARAAGVKRIVYAASSAAYGDRGPVAANESLTPFPMSPYAAAKVAGEHLMAAYAICYGLSTVSLRYFNIFGPRQAPDSPYSGVIARFAARLLRGQRLAVYGDGTQTRDFTHVSNVILANLLAGARREPFHGEVLNIASGRSSTLLELIDVMGRLLGVKPEWDHEPPRAGEVLHSRADITRAASLLGYRPVVDLEQGLKDTLAWYREHEKVSG